MSANGNAHQPIVEHIVLLLKDGRTVRLDPALDVPLDRMMAALTAVATQVAEEGT